MNFSKILITLSITILGLALANAYDVNENWQDDYSNIKYITASSIEKLDKDASSILPKVDDTNIVYLHQDGPLGKYGPTGSKGPLGKNGPMQKLKPFKPKSFNLLFNEYIKKFYGPLSEHGPLSELGPYKENKYYKGELFEYNNLATQLRALGLWSVLGPIGPFGPVGALGPLGPVGDHGYSKDKQGNYIDKNNNIVTKIDAAFDSKSSREFDLYELYSPKYASSKKDLDTSFATVGSLGDKIDDSYIINSDQKQIITILATPNHLFNQFNVELYDARDNLIAKSDSHNYINFIQFLAPKSTSYIVKITSPDKSDEYALYVTGSTKYLNKYNISGDHIKTPK